MRKGSVMHKLFFAMIICLVSITCSESKSGSNSPNPEKPNSENCEERNTCAVSLTSDEELASIRNCLLSSSPDNKYDAFNLVASFDRCKEQTKTKLSFQEVMAKIALSLKDGNFIIKQVKE